MGRDPRHVEALALVDDLTVAILDCPVTSPIYSDLLIMRNRARRLVRYCERLDDRDHDYRPELAASIRRARG